MSDLTGPRFEPQTFRSRDERVTARRTGRLGNQILGFRQIFESNSKVFLVLKLIFLGFEANFAVIKI